MIQSLRDDPIDNWVVTVTLAINPPPHFSAASCTDVCEYYALVLTHKLLTLCSLELALVSSDRT